MYDIVAVNEFIKNADIYDTLTHYCKYLAGKYDETNEGKYMIKYRALYSFLYSPLSDEKMVEFFNCFATSLDIFPISKVGKNGIYLVSF